MCIKKIYSLKILLPITAFLVCLLILAVWLINNAFFLKMETSEKYSNFLSSQFSNINRSEDLFNLPKEYKSIKRMSLEPDGLIYINDGFAYKIFFLINNELCYMYNIHGEYYTTTTYPDIYDAKTNEKIATLWEKPQGYFIFDDYIYYAYGKEKVFTLFDINGLTNGNFFSTNNLKDTHFARLNLLTKENEEINKKEYEDKRSIAYNRNPLRLSE